jgi:hypothetical protein
MMRWRYGEMINQPPPAIVSAEHRAHDCPVLFRDAAKAWITQEVSAYFLLRISLGYFNTFGQIPEGHRLLIIVDDEFPGVDHTRRPARLGHETLPECNIEIQGIR